MALFAKAQAFLASGRMYDDIEKGLVQRDDLTPAVLECVDFYFANKAKPDAAKFRTAFSVCQVVRACIICSYCWYFLSSHALRRTRNTRRRNTPLGCGSSRYVTRNIPWLG